MNRASDRRALLLLSFVVALSAILVAYRITQLTQVLREIAERFGM